jgi:two-component system, OmpR family, sensor histidine kinase BaeS
MTFRLRVFLLVLLVAATAIGATAFLTLSLAARQVNDRAEVASRHTADIAADLERYAYARGTWVLVAEEVRRLARVTGQRIRMVSLIGEVIVDTDHLEGRAGRRVVATPTLVDPRAELRIPAELLQAVPSESAAPAGARPEEFADRISLKRADGARQYTLEALRRYRRTVLLTACVWERLRQTLPLVESATGVPAASAAAESTDESCLVLANTLDPQAARADAAAVDECATPGANGLGACLTRVFTQQADTFAPPPLQLYVGAADATPGRLLGMPVLAATGAVMLLALFGTALVARRVSQPIRSLTFASGLLAAGRLDARVPSGGKDELGRLSRSFNRMGEALERAEQDQRRLVADVAHELRTPLSNIQGYLEAVQDGVVAPGPEVVASLYEEVQLQRRILDDLQVLTLAEAGSLAYRRAPAELAELVEISRIAHLAVAEAAGVALTASADGPLPIEADQHRIRQLLGNLITNAVRYTAAGGCVTLHAYAVGAHAVVDVRDTGCGIAADSLPYVFNRFWRADRARDRATGGSGLGLTIARRIAHDHDGELTVASQVGVGSTFTLTIPLARPA